jgi:hypothetical protein
MISEMKVFLIFPLFEENTVKSALVNTSIKQ